MTACNIFMFGYFLFNCLIDITNGECKDDIKDCRPNKETESTYLALFLGIAALCAIICPLICLFGPCRKKGVIWRRWLHDNFGLDYPAARHSQHSATHRHRTSGRADTRRGHERQDDTESPPVYVNIAFVDLPPSYDDVIKNADLYKFGPSSLPTVGMVDAANQAQKNHHENQEMAESVVSDNQVTLSVHQT